MADLNEVKTPSGFNKVTTASDTDMVPVGNTSLNMMTIANLKEVLGINALKLNFAVTTYTLQNPSLFSATQLYYAKAGNIVHVYFSGRTASELAANTVIALTGLPQAAIQQDFGVAAAFGNRAIQVTANQTTANATVVLAFPAGTWLRFNFSYISAT